MPVKRTWKSEKQSRTELKEGIETIIGKHYDEDCRKAPYSKAELVVMAVLCLSRRKGCVREEHIRLWITEKFRYYRLRALKQFSKDIQAKSVPHFDSIVSNLTSVFGDYNVPLSDGDDSRRLVDRHTTCFEVPLIVGRVFLRNILLEKPSGTFTFLQLPAELRIRIYEMVFTFPEIGIGILSTQEEFHGRRFHLYQREHDNGYNHIDRTHGRNAMILSPPVQQVLGILSVNKHIHNEAVPYFYRINHFRVRSMPDLVIWINKISPNRLAHIRNLSFPYNSYSSQCLKEMKNTLTVLALHNAVRGLEIQTRDSDWFSRFITVKSKVPGLPNQQKPKYAGPEALPHMRLLVRLVGIVDELSFDGDCPRIKEYLRGQMRK